MSMQGPAVGLDPSYRWMQPTADFPVWREGDTIVFHAGASLPACCVRCGESATRSVRKRFYWHTPWLYLAILASILVYAVIAMAVRKSAVVDVPYCERHFIARRRGLIAAWLLALSPIAMLAFVAGPLMSDARVAALVGSMVLGPVAALVLVLAVVRTPRATFIDDRTVKLGNVGEPFLSLCHRF